MQDALQLTDEQKKQLADLQKEIDAKLEKLLTEEQRKQFKEMRDAAPAAPGGFGRRGPAVGPPRAGRPRAVPVRAARVAPAVWAAAAAWNSTRSSASTTPRKPLRSKVLAVPALRAKYLANVRTIAEESLDWKKLGPGRRGLPQADREGSRGRHAQARLVRGVQAHTPTTRPTARGGPGGGVGQGMNLRAFAEQRQKYLLTRPR